MTPIIIKNLTGGIIKDYVASPTNAIEGREGQYSKSNGIDLFRPGFQGHITPAQNFSAGNIDITSGSAYTFASLPRAVTVDVTQTPPYVYFITGGLNTVAPRVFRSINDTNDSYNDITAHAGHNFTTLPTGTGFWGEDVALYAVLGVNYIFYSWNDGTDGDVGKATLTGSYDDDFMSENTASGGPDSNGGARLTKNVPHRLVEGPDKLLYITNGRYIASFDGTTGTNGVFVAQAYDLGPGWVATDIRVDKNYLAISAVRTNAFNYYTFFGKSKVCYALAGQSGLAIVYEVYDSFISALYPIQNVMHAFTIGKNGTTKIVNIFTNKPLVEFPSSLYGLPPYPNSIELYQDGLYWIPGDVTSDFVMQYSFLGGGLHASYLLNDGTNNATTGAANAGVLKNIQTNKLYAGGLFNGTYKVQYLNGTGGYATTNQDLRSRLYRLPYKAVIKKIQVFFSQMASGSSATISLFKNYTSAGASNGNVGVSGTDMLAGVTPSQTVTYALNGALTEYEFNCTIPASSFFLNVRVAGQISIPEIIVYYDFLK